ncbi:DUF503 domain-containing protein [Psychromonas ossibalaenae]|uniref:DUF503 domain-containing protein n=1 Tax=Psychromonas ossibalaenae TaxID=444922 RepID=UPI00036C9AF9|nr:DUF503 domain-containing protein [Psychromonas ossibalaenae]
MQEQSCFVTLVTIELLIPHAQSLKDKRQVVRSLKDRIRAKFNASVAEIAFQDKWQRAVLAVCLVGSDKRLLTSSTDKIRSLCQENCDSEITGIEQQWL